MYPNCFVVFDLETGGLKTKGDSISPITEIAMVEVRSDLSMGESFDDFIKPYEDASRYDPKALGVSHITLDLCEEKGLEASVVAKKISDFMNSCKKRGGNKKPVLVGHNIDSFDIPLLDYFLEKFKVDLGKLAEEAFTVDTKWWGRITWPEMAGFTLGDCLQKEGIDNEFAHRAITDTKANAELFIRMMKRLRGGSVPVAEVVRPRTRDSFKFQIKHNG